ELGVREVIIPKWPGEFSAFGLLTSDYRVELGQSQPRLLMQTAPDDITALFGTLEDDALTYLKRQGVDPSTVEFIRWMDGMYMGQSWDTTCMIPRKNYTDENIPVLNAIFEDAYQAAWGNRLGMPVRVSSFRATAVGRRERPTVSRIG